MPPSPDGHTGEARIAPANDMPSGTATDLADEPERMLTVAEPILPDFDAGALGEEDLPPATAPSQVEHPDVDLTLHGLLATPGDGSPRTNATFTLTLPQQLPADATAASSSGSAPDAVLLRPWRSPRQPMASLPQFLGSSLAESPDWYNDPDCEATSNHGTQVGATCGLFAVNHLLVSATAMGVATLLF